MLLFYFSVSWWKCKFIGYWLCKKCFSFSFVLSLSFAAKDVFDMKVESFFAFFGSLKLKSCENCGFFKKNCCLTLLELHHAELHCNFVIISLCFHYLVCYAEVLWSLCLPAITKGNNQWSVRWKRLLGCYGNWEWEICLVSWFSFGSNDCSLSGKIVRAQLGRKKKAPATFIAELVHSY